MAKERNGFVLYKSQWEPISDLPDEVLGMLMRAIFEYQITGKEPEALSPIYRDFKYFKVQFKMDDDKYAETSQRRAISGSIGGKQKQANVAIASSATEPKQTDASVAKLADKDKENNKDNDKEKDNDITSPLLPPSSPGGEEGSSSKSKRRKTRQETTLESAVAHYKTEIDECKASGAEHAADYAALAREICGIVRTDECPNGMVKTVMRIPEQLTYKQYAGLHKKLGSHAAVREILLSMHNKYEDYLTKSHSVNLTAHDWANRKLRNEKVGHGSPPVSSVSAAVQKPSQKEYSA